MQKCPRNDCKAPKSLCAELVSPEFQKCPHWNKSDVSPELKKGQKKGKSNAMPWTGLPMYPSELSLLSARSNPFIIGTIGSADAAKTSHLGMLYTLLFNGKTFRDWQFAGSYTLIGWENLAKYLKIKPNGKVDYPETTPTNPDFYSLFHLALKKEDQLHDVLYADSSGEVFTDWASNVDDPNAENARWIYANSSAFIFFVDCEALVRDKGMAVQKIRQLAGQVASGLENRPLVVAWSKSDKIGEILPNIKNAVVTSLTQLFPDSESIEVSNFSKEDPDKLCHVNNIEVTEYLLNQLNRPKSLKLSPNLGDTTDFFFKYKGSYGNE